MIEREKVNVLCQVCNVESRTTITFGADMEHHEDFFLRCPNCANTESGSLPVQTFEVTSRQLRGKITNNQEEAEWINYMRTY